MKGQLKGVFAILATPFHENRELDLESIRSVIEFEINSGVNGITILGVLGEVQRLSDKERSVVIKNVIEIVNGRVPVIAGTGAPGTDLAIEYTTEAQELGIDGAMISPPRLVKPNDEAIQSYFKEIAEFAKVPIIVQDEPVTYGVNMSVDLISKLSRIQRVNYIKLEDPPTLTKISRIRSVVDKSFGIFGGLGGLYAYEELRRGACGIMTGFAFPEVLCKIFHFYEKGDHQEARKLFYKALPLIRYEAQPVISLPIRKEILRRRGAIASATTRPPTAKLDSETLEEIDELLATLSP